MDHRAGFVWAGRVWPGTASVREARQAYLAACQRQDRVDPRRRRPVAGIVQPLEIEPGVEVLPADAPPRVRLVPPTTGPTDPLLNPTGREHVAGTTLLLGCMVGAAVGGWGARNALEGALVGAVVGLLIGEGVKRLPTA